MIIKCPNCGDVIQPNVELANGQHVLCETCGMKFTYRTSGIHELLCPCLNCGETISFVPLQDSMELVCSKCGGKTFYKRTSKRGLGPEEKQTPSSASQVAGQGGLASFGQSMSKGFSEGFAKIRFGFFLNFRNHPFLFSALLIGLLFSLVAAVTSMPKGDAILSGGDIISQITTGGFSTEGRYYQTDNELKIAKVFRDWCVVYCVSGTNYIATAFRGSWEQVGDSVKPGKWLYCGRETLAIDGRHTLCHKFRPPTEYERGRLTSFWDIVLGKFVCFLSTFLSLLAFGFGIFVLYLCYLGLRDYYHKKVSELQVGDTYRIRKWIFILSCFEVVAIICGFFGVIVYGFHDGPAVVVYVLIYCFVVVPLFTLFCKIRNETLVAIVECAVNTRKLCQQLKENKDT